MQTKNKPFYLKLFAIMVVTEFILLFAVLLIQGLIISKESSNIVYKSNIEKLDIIKDYAEMLLGDIETIAFNAVFDDNISVVDGIKSSDSINVNKTFELYSLIDFLKKRVVVDSRIDSVYLYHYNSDIIVTSNTGGRFSCVAYFLTLENFSPVNLHICLMACKWGSYTTLRCFRQHKRTVPLCYIPLSLFTLAPLGIGNHLKIIISLLDVSVNTREPSPCVPKKGALTKSDIDDIIEHVKKYYPEL